MVIFSFLSSLALADQTCPVTAITIDEWEDISAEIAQEKAAEIQALEEYIFTLEGEDTERKGIRTDGFIVIQQGKILYERYGRGFEAGHKHLLWSVSKSITSAILGRGVYEGKLNLDDSICEYYGDVPQENCVLTPLDLVSFSSGLDWKEVYENESNQVSSVLAMLYGVGRADMAKFVAEHSIVRTPGASVSYSTGDSTLLSATLRGALAGEYGEDYPWVLLFEPLGIEAVFERDIAGTYVGGSYAYMTPRDMGKFGQFFLNDGCWDEQRLLPDGWVSSSTTPSAALQQELYCCQDDDVSGWSWWLNVDVPSVGAVASMPDVPSDIYYAAGHWGQYIYVIPSLEVIIVQTGDDRDGSRDPNVMIPLALKLVEPAMEVE